MLSESEEWGPEPWVLEMPSDTWIDNELSKTCHEALGFEVVDWCVHYRKTIEVPIADRDR